MFNSLKRSYIHPDGYFFIAIFVFITICMHFLSLAFGIMGWVFTIWCVYFFRNPVRIVPDREGLIVSPADGKVCNIILNVKAPKELALIELEKWTRISIFLNVFDVHVNRIPIKGKITHSCYHSGKFFNASFNKASIYNERQSIVVKVNNDISIPFVQIAGLIARRIRCDVKIGDFVETGSVFGLIRFGSRMDIYLPSNISSFVVVGQRTIAGETVLADLNTQYESRIGRKC